MSDKILIEHEWYEFTIQKEIVFPDESVMLVLHDPYDYKHLLNKAFYNNYGFYVGQTINCRIDKINCSGRIFLEPEHPFYKEGNTYNFKVIGNKTIVNSLKKSEHIIEVIDKFSNVICVPTTNPDYKGERVNCVVENIKKGKLSLFPKAEKHEVTGLIEGDNYEMIISDIITASDSEEYYILKDKKNNEFPLKKKYYKNYQLSLGSKIKCKLVKIRSLWDYVFEPEHPHYNIGETYNFKVEGKEIIDNYQLEKKYFLLSSDIYGLECKIQIEESVFEQIQVGDIVDCLLIRVKKSKLILVF